jgi:hypothetical protein
MRRAVDVPEDPKRRIASPNGAAGLNHLGVKSGKKIPARSCRVVVRGGFPHSADFLQSLRTEGRRE